MGDITHEKILCNQLALGMFISELDKPWIESDFMLQGFILDNQADLEKIAASCAYVYIDRTKSVGNQFIAIKKIKIEIPRHSSIRLKAPVQLDNKKNPVLSKANRGEKVSFMDILREVRAYQAPTFNDSSNVISEQANSNNKVKHTSTVQDTNIKNAIATNTNTSVETQQQSASFIDHLSHLALGLFNKKRPKSTPGLDERLTRASHDLSNEELIIYELEPSVEEEMAYIYPVFEESTIVTRDIFDAIANGKQIDITSVGDVLDSMVESIGRTPDALLWLSKLKKADGHSYQLALHVSVTLMAFNNFLALPKEQVKLAGFAGLLQDIGKANISPTVLLKKGKLTPEEYVYAQTHVNESLAILEQTPNIPPGVLQLVSEHHERFNGSGYPAKLKGNELSLLSQSTGLIDTYCAITNHRSYAQAACHQQALDEIHSLSGKQFSSEIINQLIQFMGIYPVSSLVELNTGEVAVVIQQNQVRRLMPRIMLLLDHNKERYHNPIVLDLIYQPVAPNGEVYRINKGIPSDSYGLNPNEFYV